MSLENPVQIDLSDENSWDNLDDSQLTPQEKELLAQQFREESEWVIYFTQQELQDFQDILKSELPEIVSVELQEFAQEQKLEWLSSSDLFAGIEWMHEQLEWLGNTFDEMSYETLFWENWVMNDIELSDTAKNNISVALTLSCVKQLDELDNITEENYLEKNEQLAASLNIIAEVARQTQTTDQWNVPYEQSLSITNNGEWNYIFMDAAEWIKLFDGIFSWEISAETLEKYIEDRNLPEWSSTEITHRMSAMRDISWEQFSALWESIGLVLDQDSWDSDNNQTVVEQVAAEVVDLTEEEKLTLIEKLKKWNFMDQMLAAILEVMQNMGLYNDEEVPADDDTIPKANSDALSQETEEVNILNQKLQELTIPNMDITSLQENPEALMKIQDILEWLDNSTTAQEEFEKLFWETNNFSQISEIFKENNTPFTDPEDSSANFMTILATYSSYRKDPEVAWKEQGRTFWNAWSLDHDWTQN